MTNQPDPAESAATEIHHLIGQGRYDRRCNEEIIGVIAGVIRKHYAERDKAMVGLIKVSDKMFKVLEKLHPHVNHFIPLNDWDDWRRKIDDAKNPKSVPAPGRLTCKINFREEVLWDRKKKRDAAKEQK